MKIALPNKNSPQEISYGNYLPYVLLASCLLVYFNTLGHGFVLDDEAVITKNKFVQQGFAGFKDILSTFYWKGYWDTSSGLYRPLSLLIFAIEWAISPNNATLYHTVQLFIYASTVFALHQLLTALFFGLNKWLPFCIALLFALHPLHTEVVANIKSLDEILAFLFFVLATQQILKKEAFNWQSCLFLFLALLAKEGAIAFIAVWLLLLMQIKKQSFGLAIKNIWPLIAVTVMWLAIRTTIINAAPAVVYSYQDNSILACTDWLSQKLTAITILGRNLLHVFYPFNLSYDYSYPQIPCASFVSIDFWLALITLLGLFAVAVFYFKRKPMVSFGLLFFFITSFLTSNIGLTIGATMADRFMFTPILGLVIAGCYIVYEKTHSLQTKTIGIAGAGMIVIAVIFSIISLNANKAWKSNETLFRTHAKHVPNSARAQYNYGTTLLSIAISNTPDSLNKAFEVLTLANKLDPNNADVQGNLGIANFHLQNYAVALQWIKKAMVTRPTDAMKLNLADTYVKLKYLDSAVLYYKEALKNNIYNGNSHARIGESYFVTKQFGAAADAFREGTIAYPENAELWLNYGNALAANRDFETAISVFQKALEINPNQRMALYYIAVTYHNMGDDTQANAYMQRYQTGK